MTTVPTVQHWPAFLSYLVRTQIFVQTGSVNSLPYRKQTSYMRHFKITICPQASITSTEPVVLMLITSFYKRVLSYSHQLQFCITLYFNKKGLEKLCK